MNKCQAVKFSNKEICNRNAKYMHMDMKYCGIHIRAIYIVKETITAEQCSGITKQGSQCLLVGKPNYGPLYYCKHHK